MGKKCTKAAKNIFTRARYEAAKSNDTLRSREGAAEIAGIDRTRLARIELGTVLPYPEEAMLLADAYHAPELLNYYCAHLCPIGKHEVPEAECNQLDRMTVRVLASLDGLEGMDKAMLRIAADGEVTNDEIPQLEHILQALRQVAQTATEMRIWMEKNVRNKQEGVMK